MILGSPRSASRNADPFRAPDQPAIDAESRRSSIENFRKVIRFWFLAPQDYRRSWPQVVNPDPTSLILKH